MLMLGSRSFVTPVTGVLTRLRDWPVTAQQQARRNAMVAATACAQRRIEREGVADYIVTRRLDRASPARTRGGLRRQCSRGGPRPRLSLTPTASSSRRLAPHAASSGTIAPCL